MMNRIVLLLVVLVAVGAGAYYVVNLTTENARLRQQVAGAKGAPAPAPAARPAPAGPARTLTPGAREAMLATLREETGPVKKVWMRVDPNDAEAAGFAQTLEGVFKEAGWEVEKFGSDGLVFKPGIFLLVADEEWPSYAETANKALEGAGLGVTAARGYRAYYEEQTKEKPGWRGTKFLPDQTYVVLVGRKPEPKAEAKSDG